MSRTTPRIVGVSFAVVLLAMVLLPRSARSDGGPSCARAAQNQGTLLAAGAPSLKASIVKATLAACRTERWSSDRRTCVAAARRGDEIDACARFDTPTTRCAQVAAHQGRVTAQGAPGIAATITKAVQQMCMQEGWSEGRADCVLTARSAVAVEACHGRTSPPNGTAPKGAQHAVPQQPANNAPLVPSQPPAGAASGRPVGPAAEASVPSAANEPASCDAAGRRMGQLVGNDPEIAWIANLAIGRRCQRDSWAAERQECLMSASTAWEIGSCAYLHK